VADSRADRIKENEERFRVINARLEADLRSLPSDGEALDFICECGHTSCTEPVRLSPEEFRAVRERTDQFAVRLGHEIPDVEEVVEEHDRYAVVRKLS
jgi:hypothetical protein